MSMRCGSLAEFVPCPVDAAYIKQSCVVCKRISDSLDAFAKAMAA